AVATWSSASSPAHSDSAPRPPATTSAPPTTAPWSSSRRCRSGSPHDPPDCALAPRLEGYEHLDGAGPHVRVLQRPRGDLVEARLAQQAQPGGAIEQAADVPVVDGPHRLALLAQQIREVHDIGLVGGLGVPGPHEIAQAAPRVVVAAGLDAFGEGL